jgi:hypothetical protein
MESSSKERNLILALQAMKNNPKLTINAAAKLYEVFRTTLRRRHVDIPSRCDIPVNLRKLTPIEESILLEKILDLNT